jgi:mRNA interferase MazF
VLPNGLPVAGEILISHIRSIDTAARPIRFAGAAVSADTAALVRARLDALIAI